MEQPFIPNSPEAEVEWQALKSQGVNASTFVSLLAVTEGCVAPALVLWVFLQFHSLTKRGLEAYREKSAAEILREHGAGITSLAQIKRAFQNLEASELLVIRRGVRNTTMDFRVNWPALHAEFEEIPWWLRPGHPAFTNESAKDFIGYLALRKGKVSEALVLWYARQLGSKGAGLVALDVKDIVSRYGKLVGRRQTFEAISALQDLLPVSPGQHGRQRMVSPNWSEIDYQLQQLQQSFGGRRPRLVGLGE